ncbi:Uncharacterized oxidoreductase CzcO [Kluyvera cryocrescens]|uniref:Uncharacterized oxidoreductase CzcO n=1 Tax=Kluyvera cryocrescens TaxID=580 RepID=A0A485CU78_KLUCR|nr:Uncharacterized oxidoreductase CzcO [Kluyvera cryocrescens]
MTEQITVIDTLVVGAGQAGVAMSEHLTRLDIPHLVLEKQGIAQAWRTGRWDSLVANGPAWHDRFPGMAFANCAADGFVAKEQIADYFEAYAQSFGAPIRTGVEVFSAERLSGRPGFRIETSQGVIESAANCRRDRAFPTSGDPGHCTDDSGDKANPFRALCQPTAVG